MKINAKLINKKNSSNHRYAIISGGTGRIGGVFSYLLLNTGCKVVSLSRNKDQFEKYKKNLPNKFKKNLFWFFFDIRNSESVNNSFNFISKKFKNIDLLVNNAAPSSRGENFRYSGDNIVDEFMGVLGGSILLTEKLLPMLRRNKSSKIINVGSVWGMRAQRRKIYLEMDIGPSIITAAGKSGIINYTKFLAAREAKHGIRVNSLIPGWFPRSGPVIREDYVKNICENIPLGTLGQIEDLISPISFLLSNGSNYYTGQNFIVDGGSTIW